MTQGLTPSQTIGPFFKFALPWEDGPQVVSDGHPGRIRLEGRLIDGAGDPVPDGLIEIWQADPQGAFARPDDKEFRGLGRCPTDDNGRFWFQTVKPGPVQGQAPHIEVIVLARGLLQHLVTRIYFPDEAVANAADPVLTAVDPDRRDTLIAKSIGDRVLGFDIHLQGANETVFFDV